MNAECIFSEGRQNTFQIVILLRNHSNLWTKSVSSSALENKVVLEQGHIHLLTYCPWPLALHATRHMWVGPMCLQSHRASGFVLLQKILWISVFFSQLSTGNYNTKLWWELHAKSYKKHLGQFPTQNSFSLRRGSFSPAILRCSTFGWLEHRGSGTHKFNISHTEVTLFKE